MFLMDSQLKTVMKHTIYMTLNEEPATKRYFATKRFIYFFIKASILSMLVWWHQLQLSSELKTCALQAEK